ncbi:MAG: amidohydrolase family protein, partial [Nocardiopsaceae bacterium]|nr:amidohydrolase family protein [Nocardiopsaceae bacterium]
HVAHLAAAECAALIGAAKAAGIALTAETCPHYLSFAAEEIPDGATRFKCCPPIRYAANREALWRALAEGVIDCVASDHSPFPPELKAGDFVTARAGITSLQVALPAVWTGARERGFTLSDVARWMAGRPARLAGLPGKGAIAPGRDADLVAFDPDAFFTVNAGADDAGSAGGVRLRHRHPVTPYDGRRLAGVVTRTWLRGREILDHSPPNGSLLLRPRP